MAAKSLRRRHHRDRAGRIIVAGLGPGDARHRTPAVTAAIASCEVIVGYAKYFALIPDLLAGKRLLASGMGEEVERCREAVRFAQRGARVAVISSGDAGVYGMAGLVLELAAPARPRVEVEIVPGMTAATAAAAALGAPLMCDFAVVSLSDLLVPWPVIRRRLEAAAAGDFVTVLYNPRSRTRTRQLPAALALLRRHRAAATPVGIVTAAGTPEEKARLTRLDRVPVAEVGMRDVVIVGNSLTVVKRGRMITPRGYDPARPRRNPISIAPDSHAGKSQISNPKSQRSEWSKATSRSRRSGGSRNNRRAG